MAQEFQLSKMLPWIAGGVGLGALENKYISDQLDPNLKKINLAVAGTTGALLGSGNTAARIAGLSGIPLKEGLLFTVAGQEKFRKAQQALTDTNLETAQTSQETARIQKAQAQGHKHLAESFLVPAGLGAGALAYYAYNQRKHPSQASKYQVVGQKGQMSAGRQRIKIDVPSSAIPPEFFRSLTNAENTGTARTRFLERRPTKKAASSAPVDPTTYGLSDYARDSWPGGLMRNIDTDGREAVHSKPVRLAKTIGSAALNLTGLPFAARAAKDFGSGLGYMSAGQSDVGTRYLAGGLGNAALGYPAIGFGMGDIAANTIGRSRLLRAIEPTAPSMLGRARQRYITNTPNISQWLLNHVGRNLKGPERDEVTSLMASGGEQAVKDRFLNQPDLKGNRGLLNVIRDEKYKFVPRPWDPTTSVPKSIPGELLHTTKWLGHGVSENARRLALLARRSPNMTMSLAGMPLSTMGGGFDRENMLSAAAQTQPQNEAPNDTIPNSLQSLLNNVSSNKQMPVASQLRGLYS